MTMGSRAKFRLESESSQVSMCPNCNENTYCEILPELGKRRMTQPSLCESLLAPQYSELQKQYSEIMLSYHKLKISFTVMLVLNAILLVVIITCMVFIIPHISSKSNEKTSTGQMHVPTPKTGAVIRSEIQPSPQPTADPANIDCRLIIEKFGKLYIKGQKVDDINGKTCTMEDLIDSFKQFIKDSKNGEKKKAAFHFITNKNRLSGCRDSQIRKCLKNWQVKMNTTAINVNGESIIVPRSGVYFIYNRVSISIDVFNATMLGNIQHSVRHSNTGSRFKDLESSSIECVVKNNKFNHVSYIEQVHNLEQGDELRIALRMPPSRNKDRVESTSSFGMFQL